MLLTLHHKGKKRSKNMVKEKLAKTENTPKKIIRLIVNLGKDVPVIKNRRELGFYLKPIFIISDYMTDKDVYKNFTLKLRNLLKGCFHIRECREFKVRFKFYKEDKETYELELRHFYVNTILWYPYVELNEFRVMNGSLIADFKKNTNMDDYINVAIQILRDYHIKNTKINMMVSEVLYNLRMISSDFSLLLGVSISLGSIMDVYETNPVVRNLMESTYSVEEKPNEIENRLNQNEEILIDEYKKYDNNSISIMLRAGSGIKTKQLREFMIAIGLKPTISGETIPIPISNSIIKGGLNSPAYLYIGGLGSRKSMVMNKLVMGKAGYFCKLVIMLVGTLRCSKTVVDCGTTHLVTYFVTNKKVLKKLNGKYYKLKDSDDLRVIDASKDTFLIGKKIKVRSAATCACKGNEVCSRCIGKTVNINSDILNGYSIYETEEVTKVINQNILSTKHLLSTKTIDIEFNPEFDKFFKIIAGEINPVIRNNKAVPNIDDYAIYIDPKNIVKLNEQDYDSLFNTLIYNGKFTIVNIVNPKEKPIEIHTLEEKEIFITEVALDLMKKRKGYIYFKDLDDETKLFEMQYINNELTKPLYDFMDLINKENKDKIEMTIDNISQKLVDLLVESDINAGVVATEIILNRLIRSEEDIYKRPNFRKKKLEPYQIITVKKALMKNPSPIIGVSFESIQRQFLSSDLYEKRNAPSYMDVLFKEKVDMSNVKNYFKMSMKNRKEKRMEREAQLIKERRMQKVNL